MKVKFYSLILLFITISAFSCQKELKSDILQPGGSDTTITVPVTPPVNDTVNSIKGIWDFVSIETKSQSTGEVKIANTFQKTITFLDYLTVENSGSITIDDSSIQSSGIAYKIFSALKTYRYKNEILVDSFESPYISTFPATDSYTPYTMVTEDSVLFKKGGFTNVSAAKFKVSPSAAKIIIDRNNLTFVQPLYKDSVESISGIKYHIIQKGEAFMNFRRK